VQTCPRECFLVLLSLNFYTPHNTQSGFLDKGIKVTKVDDNRHYFVNKIFMGFQVKFTVYSFL